MDTFTHVVGISRYQPTISSTYSVALANDLKASFSVELAVYQVEIKQCVVLLDKMCAVFSHCETGTSSTTRDNSV